MGTNGFREEELVSRRMKVGNEWQTRVFPVVGGRLRLAHEENEKLSLETELLNWDGQYAVCKCLALTGKGQFVGYGTANAQRDSRLADSLIELAETRSIARALRFAGYGMEYTGAEEVSHVAAAEPEKEQITDKHRETVAGEGNPKGEPQAKPLRAVSKASSDGIGRATSAQVRALYALTQKAKYHAEDIESLLSPLSAKKFDDLSREDASRLIAYLQTEVA
jgi:hypothetical protein